MLTCITNHHIFSWHLMIVAQVLCIAVTFVLGCVQSCAQVALLRCFHLPCRTRPDHHQSPDVAKLDSSEGSTDWNVLAYHMVAFFNNYDLYDILCIFLGSHCA